MSYTAPAVEYVAPTYTAPMAYTASSYAPYTTPSVYQPTFMTAPSMLAYPMDYPATTLTTPATTAATTPAATKPAATKPAATKPSAKTSKAKAKKAGGSSKK